MRKVSSSSGVLLAAGARVRDPLAQRGRQRVRGLDLVAEGEGGLVQRVHLHAACARWRAWTSSRVLGSDCTRVCSACRSATSASSVRSSAGGEHAAGGLLLGEDRAPAPAGSGRCPRRPRAGSPPSGRGRPPARGARARHGCGVAMRAESASPSRPASRSLTIRSPLATSCLRGGEAPGDLGDQRVHVQRLLVPGQQGVEVGDRILVHVEQRLQLVAHRGVLVDDVVVAGGRVLVAPELQQQVGLEQAGLGRELRLRSAASRRISVALRARSKSPFFTCVQATSYSASMKRSLWRSTWL